MLLISQNHRGTDTSGRASRIWTYRSGREVSKDPTQHSKVSTASSRPKCTAPLYPCTPSDQLTHEHIVESSIYPRMSSPLLPQPFSGTMPRVFYYSQRPHMILMF